MISQNGRMKATNASRLRSLPLVVIWIDLGRSVFIFMYSLGSVSHLAEYGRKPDAREEERDGGIVAQPDRLALSLTPSLQRTKAANFPATRDFDLERSLHRREDFLGNSRTQFKPPIHQSCSSKSWINQPSLHFLNSTTPSFFSTNYDPFITQLPSKMPSQVSPTILASSLKFPISGKVAPNRFVRFFRAQHLAPSFFIV